eukprot:GFUD01038643.1.p1 GENE.GFUD01038643.1~~GFUD01038643.1.p1  ORF type:complete len:310 (+),score=93.51 GFUD01038643.1:59-988(+)
MTEQKQNPDSSEMLENAQGFQKTDDNNIGNVSQAELPALQQLVRRLQLGLVLDGTLGNQVNIDDIVTVINEDEVNCRKRLEEEYFIVKEGFERTNYLENVEVVNKAALEKVKHLETELEIRNVKVRQLETKLETSDSQVKAMKSMFATGVRRNGETESRLGEVGLDLAWCQDRLRRAEVEISFMKQVRGTGGIRGAGAVSAHQRDYQREKSVNSKEEGMLSEIPKLNDHPGCDKQPTGQNGHRTSQYSEQSSQGNSRSRNCGPGLLGPAPLIVPRPVMLASTQRSRIVQCPVSGSLQIDSTVQCLALYR